MRLGDMDALRDAIIVLRPSAFSTGVHADELKRLVDEAVLRVDEAPTFCCSACEHADRCKRAVAMFERFWGCGRTWPVEIDACDQFCPRPAEGDGA